MTAQKRGLFVVLEGGEGVGKTTNAAFMRQYLENKGIEYSATREPGGTPLAEELREIILAPREESMAPMAELLLVFAARAQHIEHKILPIIEQGQWCLCDRFTDATFAYQGAGRDLGTSRVEALESFVQAGLRPDCVIILDAPVEIGHQRARARAALDRMESEAMTFHQKVRDAYLARAAQAPDRYEVIDAALPLAEVQVNLASVLDRLIDTWKNHE
ncbi:Thymidylate kinase [BD1-7 clade bacterium]|uniref:Thymidylate kinase n=1 Tax=BD1-7 clade bacterium TaxID=2029982 RepID=A0A5S9QNE3_9GAMM|nr:Thymidylate kinase [BD1-7 clade bacterium]CAA0116044.1 Thymidylate kinase [BD1-7 clade bacterium]CAA0119717.1 Thymidylate kinase [BD1-7 clade bacterium]